MEAAARQVAENRAKQIEDAKNAASKEYDALMQQIQGLEA